MYKEYSPGTIVVGIKYIDYICSVEIHADAIICSLSLIWALCVVLLLCAVCLCCACVVGMGLHFCAVLCDLCGSLVVGVARGCGSSCSLFGGGVVGWALSLALLCALVDIEFKSIFGTFCFQSARVVRVGIPQRSLNPSPGSQDWAC